LDDPGTFIVAIARDVIEEIKDMSERMYAPLSIIVVDGNTDGVHLRLARQLQGVKSCSDHGAVVENVHCLDTDLLLIPVSLGAALGGLRQTFLVNPYHPKAETVGNVNSAVNDVVQGAICPNLSIQVANLVVPLFLNDLAFIVDFGNWPTVGYRNKMMTVFV
jgi:hypothetical protein